METKSTHKVEVVPLVLERHPNADLLSVARIYGYSCVTQTEQWAGQTQAAYVLPDSLVDTSRPEFSFLAREAKSDGRARIRAKRIRGVLSFGLLVPAPPGSQVGDDVAEQLGVTHYDPVASRPNSNTNRGGLYASGETASPPNVYAVKYDVESGRRYAKDVFVPGELVVCHEKCHGASSRYVFHDGQMYCGSRNEWKKEYPTYDHVTVESLLATGRVDQERAEQIVAKLKSAGATKQNLWWQALDATPELRVLCKENPGVVVYGEVYGAVQDLNYGHTKGRVSFAAFDVMKDGRWLDYREARELADFYLLPWVPVVEDNLPFDFDKICELAEGRSLVPGANHVREGVVVRPLRERVDDRVGRVVLKWVGAGYLERAKDAVLEVCE